jgi:hypothetical protein
LVTLGGVGGHAWFTTVLVDGYPIAERKNPTASVMANLPGPFVIVVLMVEFGWCRQSYRPEFPLQLGFFDLLTRTLRSVSKALGSPEMMSSPGRCFSLTTWPSLCS